MDQAGFCALQQCGAGLRAVDFSCGLFDECVCVDAFGLAQGPALFRSHGHFLEVSYLDGARAASGLATHLAGSLLVLMVLLGYAGYLVFARDRGVVATMAFFGGWLLALFAIVVATLVWQGLAPFGGWGSWQSSALFWGFIVAGVALQLAFGRASRTLPWVLTLHLLFAGALLVSGIVASIPIVSAHAVLARTPDRLTPEQVQEALRFTVMK